MPSEPSAIVFAYHNMGVRGLSALLRHGFRIGAVFSHRPDPAENCWFASVSDWCAQRGIVCHTPQLVNQKQWYAEIRTLAPDFVFSFYYRRLLSQSILDIPTRGAFNLHGSLLPKYRGCAPVNWVLIYGETTTGVTLHHMVRRADAGDIVAQQAVPIEVRDTARTLYDKLEAAADRLLDRVLPLLIAGTAPRQPQDEAQATYFGRRRPEDGRIDWAQEAGAIYNLIRSVTEPYPGAFTYLGGERLTIWQAEIVADANVASGAIARCGDDLLIGAQRGALRLVTIEWRGQRWRGKKIAEVLEGLAAVDQGPRPE